MRRIILMFIANLFRLPYMMVKVFYMAHHRSKYTKEQKYAVLHKMVRWANWGGRVKVITDGIENLPKDQSYVITPNHQGLYDTLTILEAVEAPFSTVSKIELENVFMLGSILKMIDAEFIDRDDIRQSLKVITRTAARLKEGDNFVIFPEGTRSKKGNEMNEFKAGAFKSVTISHAPIVPVALVDCFIPFDRPSIKPVTVQAHFLPAIYYDEYKDMKTHEIAAMVQERIRLKIEECTKESA